MFQRASGILLHPSSLPSRFGIGDLGPGTLEFLTFLRESGQNYWQMLPLGPTGFGDSPYQCFSAFAGNTLLISPESLLSEGLLDEKDVSDVPEFSAARVDFGSVIEFKKKILSRAFEKFSQASGELKTELGAFCELHCAWLDDYALFRAIKHERGSRPWYEWEDELKFRRASAVESAKVELSESVLREKFFQFLFFRQWNSLRSQARAMGIEVIGDIPIFVAMDSADVWRNPSQFKTREDGTPRVVAGVPPDFFSRTGQLWGNPVYDWDRMRDEGFRWWIDRMRHMFDMYDVVRIDHFRGFIATYEIPAGDDTAEHGEWVGVPGRDLFSTLKWVFGNLPLIAEDLGFITGEVNALRQEFGFPGMRVLQFGFGGDAASHDLPHNYDFNSVAYTGTHDNDTVKGWFESRPKNASEDEMARWTREREFCLEYLGTRGGEINWDFIRTVLASVSGLSIIPLQDLLGSGSEARMNYPSTREGNWQWRYGAGDLAPELAERLLKLTRLFGRC